MGLTTFTSTGEFAGFLVAINSITGVMKGHQPKQYTKGNPSELVPPKG